MYKAIIVDDEIWALRGMNGIIPWEEYGFEICRLCMSVSEALEAIDEFEPDVVFTDIRMPFQSGMDLLNKINESERSIITVIVSAYRDFSVAKQAITKGVFDYLIKPLEKEEVISLVRRAKQKLDEMKLAQVQDVTKVDLAEPENQTKDIVKKILNNIRKSPNCYLLINAEEAFSNQLTGELQKVYIDKYVNTWVYCGSLPSPLPEGMGVSMRHDSFDDLSDMIKEAAASYKGGFIFSDNKAAADIQMYLSDRYMEKINLKDVAEQFFISEAYLYELFKKNTNTTVVNFVKHIRMNHAIYLLRYTDCPIRDIAEKVGYDDPGYFGRLFRKEMSCSPETYRKNYFSTSNSSSSTLV